MTEVRGVVSTEAKAPVEIQTVVVPDPGPDECIVRVQACGVCHTDLHFREGTFGDGFPYLLGHEASGIVESIGEGVTNVGVGDFVIIAWRAPCGNCRSCRRGRPSLCFESRNAKQLMTTKDGAPLTAALGIGGFAELTLIDAGQAVKVDERARPDVAALLGCGVMTGIGAALYAGKVSTGDTVAVFGCGGVGDSAILGAALAGARQIIAVDLDARKLEWAKTFGATDTVDASKDDAVEAVRELTGGLGVDVAIEAVGLPQTWMQAFYARDLAGTFVMIGVPDQTMSVEIPLSEFFGRGGVLRSTWYGDCLPTRDFPMLVDLHLQGRLPLEKFVTETIPLDGVEDAFAKMQRGEVLRSVVVF